jgi:hypothetical protein
MRTSDRLVRIRTLDLMSEIGGQGRNGLASLALRAHGVRLSALCTSVELPTRGFSEIQVVDSIHIYQPVTGASVALSASLRITMHS